MASTTARNPETVSKRVWAAIVAAFALLAVFCAGTELLWARHHLLAGAHDLNRAIQLVKSPAALERPGSRDNAVARLRAGRSEFASARADLDLWSSFLGDLGSVPRVGDQLRSAAPAAATAYYATSSALDIVDGATPLLADLHRTGSPLVHRIAVSLSSGQADFARAASEAEAGLNSLHGVPSLIGNVGLQSDIDKLRHDLPRLHGAAEWLSVLPSILGDNGMRNYLFVWENSAEIRPAGGFIGAVDRITLNRGYMTRHFSGSAIENGKYRQVQPPIPELATTRETTWIFRDSNDSPDFPLSARLERWFYSRDTGVPITGVVDFVDQGVPDILSATGPVYLKQYHVTLTSHNALTLANKFASAAPVGYRGPLPPGANLDTYRKQFLGFEFAAILHRLQTLPTSRWGRLGQAMQLALQRKDILMWSVDPRVEAAAKLSDADGTLQYTSGDFLGIYDDNRSYNKIGPYVRESASYQTDLVQGYWLDSALTLRYHLDPSPSWMEGVGPGLGTLGNKHQFRDFIRICVPPGALVQPVQGLQQTPIQGSVGRGQSGIPGYGLTQIAGWFTMNPNETKTLRIVYAIPANDLAAGHFQQYRLTVVRQPGTRLQTVSVRVNSVGGLRLRAGGSKAIRSYSTSLSLAKSQTLALQILGKDRPSLITMPPGSRRDPLIPTRELRGLY